MPTVIKGVDHYKVAVELGHRSYCVYVGRDLLGRVGKLAKELEIGTRCAVVSDSNVAPLYGEKVEQALLEEGIHSVSITVPAGEASKSMAVAEDVCRQMLQAGLDRKSFLIALGGGVVGDLAGFCAAIFNRGIPYVQIPTTILSMVDSSVGGKTGVNTPEGKNLLGAFHQPRLVLADTDTLPSLPDREYREGFAEIIKHAAIRDAEMLSLIPPHVERTTDVGPLIARNVAIKAAVVEEDEQGNFGRSGTVEFRPYDWSCRGGRCRLRKTPAWGSHQCRHRCGPPLVGNLLGPFRGRNR